MIQLTGAAKRFGPKTLFENLDWLVTPNERAGIVGARVAVRKESEGLLDELVMGAAR